jgi:hypothetical protein
MIVKHALRSPRGNMLVLVSVFMSTIVLALMLAGSFSAIFFQHNRLQTFADEIALSGARKLNERDRLGQMNNMIARCRQLVYSSRDTYEEVNTHYPHLNNLASQLLDEARDGAHDLEIERQYLKNLAITEANNAMQTKFNSEKNRYAINLPWFKASVPSMPTPKIGQVKDIESNITMLTGFDDLESYDLSMGYIFTASKLYKKNINAKLPGSDNDLNFKITSLAAPVEKIVSPGRVILANVYVAAPEDNLRSAVQIELRANIATGLGAAGGGQSKILGTAAACGGDIQQ